MHASSYAFMYDGSSHGVVLADNVHAIAVWDLSQQPYYCHADEMHQHDAPYTNQPGLARAKERFAQLAGA